jgi:RimJ/RimL family protein N-acetyltransferase
MRREAHHKKSGFIRKTSDGKPIWWDSYVYAILKEEWIKKAQTSKCKAVSG